MSQDDKKGEGEVELIGVCEGVIIGY